MAPTLGWGQKAKVNELQQRKDSLTLSKVWGLSMILPGSGQFINKQYYKIPIIYAGIGGLGYIGYKSNSLYHEYYKKYQIATANPIDFSKSSGGIEGTKNALAYANQLNSIQNDYIRFKQMRNISYGAAGALYLLSVADAVVNFDDKQEHSVGKATILSTIFPGLGQAYNKKYWKIPILYGGFTALGYAISFNSREYKRYQKAYNYVTDRNPDTVDEFNNAISADQLKSNRDYFRRNRDYAIIGTVAVYILNIVDAHVDASLYNYEIDDNLAFRVTPTFFNEGGWVAQQSNPFTPGLRVTFNF